HVGSVTIPGPTVRDRPHELGIGPGGTDSSGPFCVCASDRCVPARGDRCVSAEAVSRAPALRFVALLFAVSVDCRLIDVGGVGVSIVLSNNREVMSTSV